MNPFLSWAIMIIVVGGLGWYYTSGSKNKGKATVRAATEGGENNQGVSKQKRKIKRVPEPSFSLTKKPEGKVELQIANAEVDQGGESLDNEEFAKRFAAVKNGVSTSSNAKSRGKEQQVNYAVANPENGSSEALISYASTRTSSSAGADADDDLSSAESPLVEGTIRTTDYVSDMLEPPAPGPSILRLTGSFDDISIKQQPQVFKPVESKKQRQQRLKNEARKLQIQEAEEQRRKLLEKQLHIAREAERREAAKTNVPHVPNPWKSRDMTEANNGVPEGPPGSTTQLLDTFESETPTAISSTPERVQQSDNATSKKWAQNLPSEEEQMRILGALNSENDWTTVSTKKGKKKSGKADEGVSDASTSETQASSDWIVPTVPTTPLPDAALRGHPLDSDWVA